MYICQRVVELVWRASWAYKYISFMPTLKGACATALAIWDAMVEAGLALDLD